MDKKETLDPSEFFTRTSYKYEYELALVSNTFQEYLQRYLQETKIMGAMNEAFKLIQQVEQLSNYADSINDPILVEKCASLRNSVTALTSALSAINEVVNPPTAGSVLS